MFVQHRRVFWLVVPNHTDANARLIREPHNLHPLFPGFEGGIAHVSRQRYPGVVFGEDGRADILGLDAEAWGWKLAQRSRANAVNEGSKVPVASSS